MLNIRPTILHVSVCCLSCPVLCLTVFKLEAHSGLLACGRLCGCPCFRLIANAWLSEWQNGTYVHLCTVKTL